MIIDSCVSIDLSRRLPAAVDFLSELEASGAVPAISALTVTEILRGVRKEPERLMFESLFERWHIVPVDLQIAIEGANYLKAYRASHNLDIVDALIAATASSLGRPLVTLNLKHFPMFPDLRRPC
jgi:predicted nucleic acid-binding protein